MISEAIINVGIVSLTCLLLVIYSIRFVLRYKHESESNALCTLTVILCLLVVLIITFLLPIDIFLVSFIKEPDGSLKSWATKELLQTLDRAVFAVYYSLYGLISVLIFVIIPFLHFFNDETESNSRDRLHNSIKYTIGFAMIMVMLLTVGTFVPETDSDPNSIFNKIAPMSATSKLQNALTMVLAFITTGGFLNVAFYTASGIFSWPIGLLMGTSSVSHRFDDISNREIVIRTKISTLQGKARMGNLTAQENEQLAEALRDLTEVEREGVVLAGHRRSLYYKLRGAIRPVQILIGALMTILSILLVATLIMVNVDRFLHSSGPKQGYVLLDPTIFNPLEYVFMRSQDLVIIGPMPVLITTCFLLVATISGMRNLGLWFAFAKIYRIKTGRTQPQALLFFCISLMLTALAFNLTVYSISMNFVSFGDQNYRDREVNGTVTVKPCTLGDYNPDCILTRSSILIMRTMSQVWIFGAIFYWIGWAFVLVAAISFIAYLVRGKREATHGLITDTDEFED